LFDLLGQESFSLSRLAAAFPWLQGVPSRAMRQLRAEACYSGYMNRQKADIRRFQREESISLEGLPYHQVGGLSAEVRDRLARLQPVSIGVASRMEGVTPAAIAALLAHIHKERVSG
jgi:tRNA uridine 5-carboxymethylaminomethyl modification enzyme